MTLSIFRVSLGCTKRKLASSPTALRTLVLSRFVQTNSLPPKASVDILNEQRLRRPESPHLTIYRPQVTSVLSIGHRFAGVGLSVVLYSFSIAYLVAPDLLSSTQIVELTSALPATVKIGIKAILAAPFVFHSLNGMRHLAWDVGFFLSLKGVYRTGYAVIAATALGTGVLVAMGL